jgi:serine/threonine protein kinase
MHEDGRPVITDFEFAVLTTDEDTLKSRSTLVVSGTRGFMAPEVLF